MKRIVVGVSGASGTTYALNLLQKLHELPEVEIHLVASQWAEKNLALETNTTLAELKSLADYTYDNHDLGVAIASGSFLTDGMVVIPASMKTVASIANAFDDTLIARAADVTIKEMRRLIIVPRESPLSMIHLENLAKLARVGAQIIPPIPAFYNHPRTTKDLVDHQSMKIMDAFGIQTSFGHRWEGE
ncbi:UbiX family flavin prenyltransferase [uncultured Limosilactobacillus sp.]|uniref:UbiX family flavin prenyltransferase n=1 Tax=uncultured Limosilactobacillus sp. TaxID=2837629 RepID=UPI0025FBA10C|nr:UbiX family flavin prenyltransferase [uncultured Limosilactobacillus sp.]